MQNKEKKYNNSLDSYSGKYKETFKLGFVYVIFIIVIFLVLKIFYKRLFQFQPLSIQ